MEASKVYQQEDEKKITIEVDRNKNIVARRLQKQDIDKDTNNINEKNFVARRRIAVRRRRIKDD